MLTRSAEFHHIPDLTTACFYGDKRQMTFSVVRTSLNGTFSRMDQTNRIYIVRRFRNSNKWKCAAPSCSGLSSQLSESCIHTMTVQAHIQQGLTNPFSNLFLLQSRNTQAHFQDEEEVETPRHARQMIPSELAFEVNDEVICDARSNPTRTIAAARACHCGCQAGGAGCSLIARTRTRVEASRCHANYLQEVWICGRGHRVLPEEDELSREGVVWISKDTAFTEVFLFDMLLHMVLGGTTISSQADIRSQMLFLQNGYTTRQEAPVSHQSVRKALTIYAMSVVKGMEDWVFRCQKCAITTEHGVYYEKLSFDGQQIGFNIRHDVRYDFHGKKATAWRKTVDCCSHAWQSTHLVESHALRAIITESLRVRKVPVGCNSVHTLCRVMINVPMNTKQSIRAATAAIKLFDDDWRSWIPYGHEHADDPNFQTFQQTHNPYQSSHPLKFVAGHTTPEAFHKGKRIMALFVHVIDAKKAAYILAVLLAHLREGLKKHVPSRDASFLELYSVYAYNALNDWLIGVSQTESWAMITPAVTFQDLQDTILSGIAEHASTLHHPYRSTWPWRESQAPGESEELLLTVDDMICTVRDVGP